MQELQWTRRGQAVALSDGNLILGGPGRQTTESDFEELPEFRSMVLSDDGDRAAVAAFESGRTTIWVIDLGSEEVVRLTSVSPRDVGEIEIAGWDSGGRWVFYWTKFPNSESLDADGSPLSAVDTVTGDIFPITESMISERDQLTWCGDRLVFTDGGGRFVTQERKSIAEAMPPLWTKEILAQDGESSFIDPTCDASGGSVAAITVPVDGDADHGALVSLESGLDVMPPAIVHEVMHGFRFPEYWENGDLLVLEYYWADSGDPELIVLDEDGMRTIGDLLGGAASPMLGGSPRWDWHQP